MGAEQFGLHHFGKAEDGIERRAQFMAHRGEEARFGEIGFFGPPPCLVGIGLGLFEFGDQRFLFHAEGERGERGRIEALGEDDEIELGGGGENRQRQRFVIVIRLHEDDDGERDRQQRGIDRIGNRRRDERAHRRDEQQDEEDEGAAPWRPEHGAAARRSSPRPSPAGLRRGRICAATGGHRPRPRSSPGISRPSHSSARRPPRRARSTREYRSSGTQIAAISGDDERQPDHRRRGALAAAGENAQQLDVESAVSGARGGELLARFADLRGDPPLLGGDLGVDAAPALDHFRRYFTHRLTR